MKTNTFFLISLFWVAHLHGQNAQVLLESVLKKLYAAADNRSITCPSIKPYAKLQTQVAWYDGASKTIFVEQKAIDACLSLGQTDAESALAFVIGHELIHAFQKERNRAAFAEHGCNDAQKYQKETDADVRGAFLAHLAQYKTRSLLPKIFTTLYHAYQFTDQQLPCYRTENERQKTALMVQNKVDSLEKIFEAAQFLGLLGQYDASINCYKYILDYYRGSEVINDLAVMLTHRAMNTGGKTVDTFLLPLEMDADFRIAQLRAEPLSATERQVRERDLDQALFYAREVLATNKSNDLTRINITSILILKNNFQEAQKNSIILLKSRRFGQEGQLLNAIIDALSGHKDKAKQALKDLSASPNTRVRLWATYNLSVLVGEKSTFAVSEKCALPQPKAVDQVYSTASVHKLKMVRLNENSQIAWENRAHSVVYAVNAEGGKKTTVQVVHQAIDNFDMTKLSAACIVGQKSALIATCRTCGLVFHVRPNGQVSYWAKVLN